MGVEGTCRSGNRGGCPFCPLPYIAGLLPCIPFCPQVFPFAPSCLSSGKKHLKQGKTGQKLSYICSLLCFLGVLRDRKGRNAKIYLEGGANGAGCAGSAACLLACPLVQVVQGCSCYFADVSKIVLTLSILACSLPFVRLPALLVVRCL